MEPDLEEVRNRAIQAFWASVVENMPDTLTGDISPHDVYSFDNFADDIIDNMVQNNINK